MNPVFFYLVLWEYMEWGLQVFILHNRNCETVKQVNFRREKRDVEGSERLNQQPCLEAIGDSGKNTNRAQIQDDNLCDELRYHLLSCLCRSRRGYDSPPIVYK